MAYQEIQIGDTGQEARDKLDNNFDELYGQAQSWSSTIQFDSNYGSFNTNTHTQSAQINFVVSFTGASFGLTTHRIIVSNGNNFVFPAGYITINTDSATGTKALGTFTPVADKQYRVIFECVDVSNSKYNVVIVDFETTAQLTAPVLSSATPSGLNVTLVYTDPNTYPPEVQVEIEIDTVNTFDSGSEYSEFAAKDSTGYIVAHQTIDTFYYRIRAVGDGTNTQTSSWSNILSATTTSTIIVQDDFTGTTIDTGKWTEVDPADVGEITQNNTLIGTFTGTVTGRTNYLDSLYDNTGESVVTVQFTISNVLSATASGNWWSGLWYDNTATDEIMILGTTANPSLARLFIRLGSVTQYDFNSSVSINNTWKVLKNGNNISFYYWSGSAWVQVGTTQSVVFTNILKPFASLGFGNNGNVINYDNFYFANADYSTSTPI